MAKKVLLINSSFRKKNTYKLLLQVGELIKKNGFEIEIINLFDYNLKDCIGCETCIYHNDNCALSDDMNLLRQKFLEADGIVFSSPVYMRSVTSKFKVFADRTCKWFHKPEPAGKPVMFIATTASTGLKETKQFYEGFAIGFGGRIGEFVARKENELDNPITEKEIKNFLKLLKTDKSEYHPKNKELIIFIVQKILALKSGKSDKAFWENKGWLTKKYYYQCKINVFKTLFSKMMFKIISKAMK